MAQKNFNHKLSYHIAEESQLLAEERWLIDALAKIKKQRNCLQIERLHLESMKVKLKHGEGSSASTSQPVEPNPSTSAEAVSQVRNFDNAAMSQMIADEICNIEELDLAVTKSVFGQAAHEEYNIEEEDDDEDDYDNIVIDINMLMNGKPQ